MFLIDAAELTAARLRGCDGSCVTADWIPASNAGSLSSCACCFRGGAALLPAGPFPFFVPARASENSGLTHLLLHVPGWIVLITLIKESSRSVRWCFDIVEMKLRNIQADIPQSFPTRRNPWVWSSVRIHTMLHGLSCSAVWTIKFMFKEDGYIWSPLLTHTSLWSWSPAYASNLQGAGGGWGCRQLLQPVPFVGNRAVLVCTQTQIFILLSWTLVLWWPQFPGESTLQHGKAWSSCLCI